MPLNKLAAELYAEVLVDIDSRGVDRSYHYGIPSKLSDLVTVGSIVLISFGRRKITGYVLEINSDLKFLAEEIEVKNIEDVLDTGPVFTPQQLSLARWLSEYYLCTLVSALQTIISPRIRGTGPKKIKGLYPASGVTELNFSDRAVKSRQVWQVAKENPGLTRRQLAVLAGASETVVGKMVSMGLLQHREIKVRRNPYPKIQTIKQHKYKLTSEQDAALKEIISAMKHWKPKVFLLFGVTGSGKTEVYIRSIIHALSAGKRILVMVPEIALTPQMVIQYKGYFGEQVAVLHSRLSDGERYDEWNRIADGEASVILGTRSAAFAPLSNLGLVIVDEEHEPSYKQEETPRYHARDVALKLISQHNAVAVLGSATPSLESYQRALSGGPYRLLTMLNRVEERALPLVQLIDMKEELKKGNPGILSGTLIDAIKERLERKEQIVLFLNRRGYATLVVCRECGLVMKCSHCDISLTYHVAGHLSCHYCNAVFQGEYCPDCGSKLVERFGAGTQRLELEIKKHFPEAGILRMDSDTTGRKGSHAKILNSFQDGKADILIGTQMVAKGLDVPDVTLVGVVNADTSLHMPDFRAAERTFQLIAQVAGRTGRGKLGGEVLVQTFTPKHYSIVFASKHDYTSFFQHEINIRKKMRYPPFTRLARVLVSGKDVETVTEMAEKLAVTINKTAQLPDYNGLIEVLGPSAANISKIKDRYRYHLVIKSKSGKLLKEILMVAIEHSKVKQQKDNGFVVDIDPQNLM